ncbi:MAG: hypothetical protein WC796_02900 [Candidatus Pacearchaeota archaeon]|jgi:hypothetical protein
MGIEDYLSSAVSKSKASFSSDRGKWVNYLVDHELGNYFSGASDEERQKMRNGLERIVDTTAEKYHDELGGIARKGVSKGTMGLAVLNDLYAYVSNVPIANVTGLGYALFALKTAAEVPALYRYLKKSGDWYGEAEHLALKPLRYLLPVIGPALESGAFERMVRRNIMNEARLGFIKEFGNYVSIEDRVKERLKTSVSDAAGVKAAA